MKQIEYTIDDIRRQIGQGRQAAAKAQRWDEQQASNEGGTAAPESAPAATPQPDKPKDSIMPYTLIRCLQLFDNIYETRLFGWVLAKAQSVLKLYNKDLKDINLQHALNLARVTLPARLLLADGDTDYGHIKRCFTLADKKIEYQRDGHTYNLAIIAFPELYKDGRGRLMLTFVIHNEIWHALLDFSKGHRLFHLPTFARLQSKYAIIMYLLISQQAAPKKYGILALRQILGCDQLQAYDRGANFVNRILEPSKKELDAKAPWTYDYQCNKFGRSNKICEVILTPKANPNYTTQVTEHDRQAARLRCRLDDDVAAYIMANYDFDPKGLEAIERYVLAIGDKAHQLQSLGRFKTDMATRRIRNRKAYLTVCLKNQIK